MQACLGSESPGSTSYGFLFISFVISLRPIRKAVRHQAIAIYDTDYTKNMFCNFY